MNKGAGTITLIQKIQSKICLHSWSRIGFYLSERPTVLSRCDKCKLYIKKTYSKTLEIEKEIVAEIDPAKWNFF